MWPFVQLVSFHIYWFSCYNQLCPLLAVLHILFHDAHHCSCPRLLLNSCWSGLIERLDHSAAWLIGRISKYTFVSADMDGVLHWPNALQCISYRIAALVRWGLLVCLTSDLTSNWALHSVAKGESFMSLRPIHLSYSDKSSRLLVVGAFHLEWAFTWAALDTFPTLWNSLILDPSHSRI